MKPRSVRRWLLVIGGLNVLLLLSAAVGQGQQAGKNSQAPGMKETMTWIQRYLNEEAGGQDHDVKRYANHFKYKMSAVPEFPSADTTISFDVYQFLSFDVAAYEGTVSFNLKDLNPEKIRVEIKGKWHLLILPCVGEKKLVTHKNWVYNGKKREDKMFETAEIHFLSEESAKKAARAFRNASVLAGAHLSPKDPFASTEPEEGGKKPQKQICLNCRGTGTSQVKCLHCNGSGKVKCDFCGGSGKQGLFGDVTCGKCNGEKTISCASQKGKIGNCDGTGFLKAGCIVCQGTGRVKVD